MKNIDHRWERRELEAFDPSAGEVRTRLPDGAVQVMVNLVDSDGLICSSRAMIVKTVCK